jgi:hypothetical protein
MTDVVKRDIAAILKIPVSDAWDIYSDQPDKNLYLIHYNQEANMARFGELRGIVVDTRARTKVCQSFGYTPVVTDSQIKPSTDGNFHLIDTNQQEHVLVPTQVTIKLGFEGTVIRVFKHDGVVYHSTHRRLKPTNSRWGDSIPFLEMYTRLNGPADDVLFNSQSAYSPYCHIFLMVHPGVLVATKQDVGSGYLVYLGARQMWSTDYATCPYKQTRDNGDLFVSPQEFELDPRPNAGYIDPELYEPNFVQELPAQITHPVTFSPFDFDLAAANKHLHYGFYDPFDDSTLDPRLGTGEFIMLYITPSVPTPPTAVETAAAADGKATPQPNSQVSTTVPLIPENLQLLKIQSKAYQWRSDMRDNNPNLRNRMFQLLNGSYIRTETPEGYHDYVSRFPLLTAYSPESILQLIQEQPIIVWPQEAGEVPLTNADERYANIWRCFLVSVPLNRQGIVADLYQQILDERDQVITWLQEIDQADDLNNEYLSDRAKGLIRAARNRAQIRTDKGENVTRDGRTLSLETLSQTTIRRFIYNEEGSSLYNLVRSMKEFTSERTANETAPSN